MAGYSAEGGRIGRGAQRPARVFLTKIISVSCWKK